MANERTSSSEPSAGSDASVLEVFPNPKPGRNYRIVHVAHEFTSMCPITGHPDFATLRVSYVPSATCVELKSLKIYLHGYRNVGVFYEALINRIADDLATCMQPRRLTVRGEFRGRGGISSVITANVRGTKSSEAAS